jgi:5-methylcytosine-specific restriction endonuclease McrA
MKKIDKKTLEEAVKTSQTKREVLLKLGRSDSSSSYNFLRRYLNKYNVDTTGLLNKSESIKKMYDDGRLVRCTNDAIFCENSIIARSVLKSRILTDGLIPYICGVCGDPPVWKGKELVLILDHKNGIRNDNRPENLRFVCPNCESQLTTHCRGNYTGSKRKKTRSKEEYYADRDKKYTITQEKLIPLILTSGIDFTKFGWVKQVSVILKQPEQKVNKWMKRFMPDVYNNQCFKRKMAP